MNDPDLVPVRVQTLADQATERLRNAIQRGSLTPGSQLVERDLAERLGMSRVPIREAIQRLAEEGLVKKTAHRGTIVYLPSEREIEEITSVRIVLEQLVAERVALGWNPEHEAKLRTIVDDIRTAVRARDRRTIAELDTAFHTTTWHSADHQVLMEMTASLRQRVSRLLNETVALMPDDELTGAVDSHERLIKVFKRGNVSAAKDEMRRHILAGQKRILAAYAHSYAGGNGGNGGNGRSDGSGRSSGRDRRDGKSKNGAGD